MLTGPSGKTGCTDRFLLLFALANAGGVVAYLPFLTLLLPAKVALLAGDMRVEWLGAATLGGALVASVAGIGFGWASDVCGTRLTWVGAGLGLTLASYVPLHLAASPGALVLAVMLFQASLNMMLAPLAAWAADVVPADRLGLLGGLMGAGAPVGALAGVLATLPALEDEWMRMAVVGGLVFGLTTPLLTQRSTDWPIRTDCGGSPLPAAPAAFLVLLAARFLAQVAGGMLFAYLLFYFQSLPGTPSRSDVAWWSASSIMLAFPVSLMFGRWSDRLGMRTPFLVASATGAALGLSMMAWQPTLPVAVGGFALFGCANAVFLTLLSIHAIRLLPAPERRGRDLGVLNLGNTLPSVVAPLLAVAFMPGRGFGPLLAGLAMAMLLAAACILFVDRRHETASR